MAPAWSDRALRLRRVRRRLQNELAQPRRGDRERNLLGGSADQGSVGVSRVGMDARRQHGVATDAAHIEAGREYPARVRDARIGCEVEMTTAAARAHAYRLRERSVPVLELRQGHVATVPGIDVEDP